MRSRSSRTSLLPGLVALLLGLAAAPSPAVSPAPLVELPADLFVVQEIHGPAADIGHELLHGGLLSGTTEIILGLQK